ncbi:ephrin type-B receptor 1-B-like [Physella acuta]|uniref:ephrin type-B receptor 1-B-like n=1 Tax=Physella acuta TaxID=109671 RepID=UPI0027DCFE49|nr:ephrin type-B receptor 1-B-like [Physella acuta]
MSKWSAPKDSNNKIQWRTIKSPNLKTNNIVTEDVILNGKPYLSITWSHVKKIEDFKIYPDPELFNKGFTLATRGIFSVLVIQGRNIPTWLNKDEIHVYVGKVSCNVLDTTESTITCNATSIVNNIENSCNTSSTNQAYVYGTTTAALNPVGATERILPKVRIVFTHITVEDNSNTVIIISVITIVAVVVLALVVYLRISRLRAKNNTSMKALDEGVESVSQSIDLKGFVQEAVMMREFQHPNVLGLVGLSEKEPGVPFVVLPFMENGDLLTYVRDPDKSLKFSDALKYGADIASGMAYLSIRDFVHRDLAARNCLLDDRLRVKIGDFGLCRSVYGSSYYTSTNRTMLPIRWMAPESIEVGCYSTKSDVWSFGVVMWELLTRGLIPYPGLQNSEVHGYLQQSRLARPHFCPIRLYEALLYCWQVDPGLRPNFQSLQEFLRFLFRSISRANDKCRDCIDTLQRGKDPQGQRPQNLTIPQTELNTPCSGICLMNKSFDAEIIIPECRCLFENIAESTNRDNLAKAENMEYIQPKDDWNYLLELLHQEMPASEEIGGSYIDVIDNYEEIGGSYIDVIDNYEEITTTM